MTSKLLFVKPTRFLYQYLSGYYVICGNIKYVPLLRALQLRVLQCFLIFRSEEVTFQFLTISFKHRRIRMPFLINFDVLTQTLVDLSQNCLKTLNKNSNSSSGLSFYLDCVFLSYSLREAQHVLFLKCC